MNKKKKKIGNDDENQQQKHAVNVYLCAKMRYALREFNLALNLTLIERKIKKIHDKKDCDLKWVRKSFLHAGVGNFELFINPTTHKHVSFMKN